MGLQVLSIWHCCKDSPMLMLVSHFFELASRLVYSSHKRAQCESLNMNTYWGNFKISSYFSFWKLNYFFDMAFLRNIFDTRKILDDKPFMFFFLNPANHIEIVSVISKSMEPGWILLNINPILIREIPTTVFPV